MKSERRSFLSGMMVAAAGLPIASTLLGSALANADTELTDNDSAYLDWAISPTTPGGEIRYKILWAPMGEPGNEASAKLIRLVSGVVVPRHRHPDGEFTYVITGSVLQEEEFMNADGTVHVKIIEYGKGASLYMPPGSIHLKSQAGPLGVTTLSMTPKKIVFF